MTYIDFDGVILDTEELLFENWRKLPNHELRSEKEKIEYIKRVNWDYVLHNSEPINNSISYLKEMNPKETFILTKIHSLTNEGSAKIKWIRENHIRQGVYLVPYNLKKTEMVEAKGNILIDDSLKNLDDWVRAEGYPVFFDMNDDNYDSWDRPNINNYQKVLSLAKFTSKKD